VNNEPQRIQPDTWIPLAKAAEYAFLSLETVRRAARRGRLRCIKVNGGRVWRTRREWVDAWLTHTTREKRYDERTHNAAEDSDDTGG
jgi:excisionase family DNA binding protein